MVIDAPTGPARPGGPNAPGGPGSTEGGAGASTRRRSRWLWLWILLGVIGAAVMVTLYLGRPTDRPRPLDATSEWPDGQKGVVLLLRDVGAEVDVTGQVPDDLTDVDVVYLPADLIPVVDEDRYRLEEWVSDGGRLVVADPYSQFTAYWPGNSLSSEVAIEQGSCDIAALRRVREVIPGPAAGSYQTDFAQEQCFTEDFQAFVTASGEGSGTIVSVGGPYVFANAYLDQADNAGLAVALLAPEPGTRVAFIDMDPADIPFDIERPDVDPPNPLEAVIGLMPPEWRLAFLQLVVAFILYAWWRGRRLGTPVPEGQPVLIDGSELVQAVGRLLERSRDPERAARVLRADLRRSIADHLGLPRESDASLLAKVSSERTGIDPGRVLAALTDSPLESRASLLEVAQLTESVRQEVLNGSAP